MGNLPSKDHVNEIRTTRRTSHGSNESTHLFPTKMHFNSKRRSKETTVSPVRHQRVTADPTCLSSITSESFKLSPRSRPAELKRNPSSQDSEYFSEDDRHPEVVVDVLEDEFAFSAEKERDRQTREHYILKQVLKGNYHVELNQPLKILDSACGVGIWSIEMGEEYPECEVTGIDVLPPSEKHGWKFSKIASKDQANVVFQYENICENSLSFSDNTFDFVFQRDVSTIVPYSQWPSLICELYRITAPEGKIQLVEYEMGFQNPGPVAALLNEWYRSVAAAIHTRVDYAHYIPEYLENAGFTSITKEDVDIPIGEWSTDPLQRQYGYLYKEQIKTTFKSMKGWWCKQAQVSFEEYDRVCEETLNEFEIYQSKAKWFIFTAKKPI